MACRRLRGGRWLRRATRGWSSLRAPAKTGSRDSMGSAHGRSICFAMRSARAASPSLRVAGRKANLEALS